MLISSVALVSLPKSGDSQIISAPSLRLDLPQPPNKFFRHAWQSWILTTWLDPGEPPIPVRAEQFLVDGRTVDFHPVVPIPASQTDVPVWLAKGMGMLKMAFELALTAFWENRKL